MGGQEPPGASSAAVMERGGAPRRPEDVELSPTPRPASVERPRRPARGAGAGRALEVLARGRGVAEAEGRAEQQHCSRRRRSTRRKSVRASRSAAAASRSLARRRCAPRCGAHDGGRGVDDGAGRVLPEPWRSTGRAPASASRGRALPVVPRRWRGRRARRGQSAWTTARSPRAPRAPSFQRGARRVVVAEQRCGGAAHPAGSGARAVLAARGRPRGVVAHLPRTAAADRGAQDGDGGVPAAGSPAGSRPRRPPRPCSTSSPVTSTSAPGGGGQRRPAAGRRSAPA